MRAQKNLYGEAIALNNVARTYEYMANITKACETLETVSVKSAKYIAIRTKVRKCIGHEKTMQLTNFRACKDRHCEREKINTVL